MKNEVIYIPNARLIILEQFENHFKANIFGNTKIIKEIEKIGSSFTDIPDFKALTNPILLASPLINYLNKAHISFTLAKRREDITQYLGLLYEKPNCQFYLIKEDLQLRIYFKKISLNSESSSNFSPTSDWRFPLLDSKNHHPQEFSYSL